MESRNGDANTPSEALSRQTWLLDLGSGTGALPQLYAAGADNPFHAQALVGVTIATTQKQRLSLKES